MSKKDELQKLGFNEVATLERDGELFVVYEIDDDYIVIHNSWNPLEVYRIPIDEMYEHRDEFKPITEDKQC